MKLRVIALNVQALTIYSKTVDGYYNVEVQIDYSLWNLQMK